MSVITDVQNRSYVDIGEAVYQADEAATQRRLGTAFRATIKQGTGPLELVFCDTGETVTIHEEEGHKGMTWKPTFKVRHALKRRKGPKTLLG